MADCTAHILAVDKAKQQLENQAGRVANLYKDCIGVPEAIGDLLTAYWRLREARRLLRVEMLRNTPRKRKTRSAKETRDV